MIAELDQLDALLIAYKYDAGVRAVICENLVGLVRETVYGDYLRRLIRLGMVDESVHQTNIFAFVKDLEKSKNCPPYLPPQLERNRVLEVLERFVH